MISARVAEELSRDPKRYVDSVTAAAWGAETIIGASGAGLKQLE